MKTLLRELFQFKLAFFLVIGVILVESITTGLIPHTKGYLYGFLESKNPGVWLAIVLYFLNSLLLESTQAIKAYVCLKLSLKARTSRTLKIFDSSPTKKDTTPQRIQEDVKLSYNQRLTVLVEYAISGLIFVQLLVLNLDQPLLIVCAIAYAAVSIYLAIFFNRRLNKAEIVSQEQEAQYRISIFNQFDPSYLPHANKASLFAGRIQMQYGLFSKLQISLLTVAPYIILVPLLFTGVIDFGTLIKHSTTFSLMAMNLSILIYCYIGWIKGTASEKRVIEIEK